MGTYQFMMVFSNCSFMGYPVISALMGKEAIFYMSILLIPFNILAFTYGIWLLSSGQDNGTKFNFKQLINSGTIASIAAVIIYANHFRFPVFIEDACSIVGNITTPLSMIVLGISLAQVPVKEMFNEIRVYPVAAVRLIGLPFLANYLIKIFTSDIMIIAVVTSTAAMPAASMCVMLSGLYGGNEKLASVGVFITTVLSVITIPIILSILIM